ncbi:MAG: sulfotransferase [Halofilum sp. (in: g-proteobacteria)]|nr:sulfotransferase [Halofilum sp. (in: g-proteobacteria)]
MGRKASGRKRKGGLPSDPQQLFQQAVAAYEAGRYCHAQKALEPLLDLPDPQGFITLLAGLVHVALGEWKPGEKWLTAAVRMQPNRIEGWMGLGNAQRMLGNAEGAIDSFRRALKLQPNSADVLNNLAIAYADMRLDLDAIAAFDAALARKPDLVGAKRGRAEALVRMGRFEEASSAYCELREVLPDDAGLALDFAEVLERANRVDEAEQVLPEKSALETSNEIARRDVLCAGLMSRQGRVEEAIDLLQQSRRDTGQEWIGYAEGKLRDRIDDVDGAMACFRSANAARREQWMFRRLRDQDVIPYLDHKIGRGISRASATYDSCDDGSEREPLFIVGLPRSGTTLLDRMLAAHPDVQVLEEPESLRVAESVIASGGTVEQARARYRSYLDETIGLEPDRLIVDKNPLHSMHLDQLPALFPNARVIYSLRHPCDAALSCYMQDFSPNPASLQFLGLESTARLCARLLDMMRLFEEANPDRVRRVRYEDLVARDLREQLEPILLDMGLAWHDDIKQFSEKASQSGLIRTASYEQVTRGLYTTSIERWRKYDRTWLQPRDGRDRSRRLSYWGRGYRTGRFRAKCDAGCCGQSRRSQAASARRLRGSRAWRAGGIAAAATGAVLAGPPGGSQCRLAAHAKAGAHMRLQRVLAAPRSQAPAWSRALAAIAQWLQPAAACSLQLAACSLQLAASRVSTRCRGRSARSSRSPPRRRPCAGP